MASRKSAVIQLMAYYRSTTVPFIDLIWIHEPLLRYHHGKEEAFRWRTLYFCGLTRFRFFTLEYYSFTK